MQYEALSNGQLKTTVQTAVKKYWQGFLKAEGIEYEVDTDGFFSDIETLGEDFIVENLINSGSLAEEYETLTLGELAESKEFEQDLVQFDINVTNVEKLLNGPNYGLIRTPLTTLIEVIYPPKSDTPIIRGGRHRVVALLTLLKGVKGHEDMLVPVSVYRSSSLDDVARQIEMSNTTRRMTATEKAQLKMCARGAKITVYSDPSEIFASAEKNAKTVTDLKTLTKIAFVALLSNNPVAETNLTTNTMGDIGSSFINKVAAGLKGLQKGADKVLLAKTERGMVFEALVRAAAKVILDNWDAYSQEITTSKEDKKTGEVTYECNYARHAPKAWGELVSEVIMNDVGEKLVGLYKNELATEAKGKAAKQAETQAQKLDREMKNLDASLEMFTSRGIPIPAELSANIEREKAAIQARIDALQEVATAPAPPAPAAPVVEDDSDEDDVSSLLA